MRIEDTSGPLRSAGELLLQVATVLAGRPPSAEDWGYKCSHRSGSGYAWIRLIGDRARKYPPQSIHVVVKPHVLHDADKNILTGQDWWGAEDRHVVAVAANRGEVAHAVEVLARAFRIDDGERM